MDELLYATQLNNALWNISLIVKYPTKYDGTFIFDRIGYELLFVKNAFINFSTFSVSRETDSFGNEEFVLSFLSSNFF